MDSVASYAQFEIACLAFLRFANEDTAHACFRACLNVCRYMVCELVVVAAEIVCCFFS